MRSITVIFRTVKEAYFQWKVCRFISRSFSKGIMHNNEHNRKSPFWVMVRKETGDHIRNSLY